MNTGDRELDKGFAIIPRGLITIWPHLKDNHRQILPALLSHMGKGTGTPGQKRIAAMSGYKVRNVNKILGELHRIGLVDKRRRKSPNHLGDTSCVYTLADVDDEATANRIIERCQRPQSSLPERPVLHAFGIDLTDFGVGVEGDAEDDFEDETDANPAAEANNEPSVLDHEAWRNRPACVPPMHECVPTPTHACVPTPYATLMRTEKNTEQIREKINDNLPAAAHAGPSGVSIWGSEAARLPSAATSVCSDKPQEANASGQNNRPAGPQGQVEETQPSKPEALPIQGEITSASYTQASISQAFAQQPIHRQGHPFGPQGEMGWTTPQGVEVESPISVIAKDPNAFVPTQDTRKHFWGQTSMPIPF